MPAVAALHSLLRLGAYVPSCSVAVAIMHYFTFHSSVAH
jgi:hypothetical protein